MSEFWVAWHYKIITKSKQELSGFHSSILSLVDQVVDTETKKPRPVKETEHIQELSLKVRELTFSFNGKDNVFLLETTLVMYKKL